MTPYSVAANELIRIGSVWRVSSNLVVCGTAVYQPLGGGQIVVVSSVIGARILSASLYSRLCFNFAS